MKYSMLKYTRLKYTRLKYTRFKYTRFKIAIVAGALLLAAGCGKGEAGSKGAEGSKNEKKTESAKSAPKDTVTIEGDAQQKAGIEVGQVQARSIPQTLNAAGQLVADENRTVHVGAYTEGRVMDVTARIGDVVRRGQVLARLHSHDVHEIRGAYEKAQQEVLRQQNQVEYARRVRDRSRRLLEIKAGSQQELERAEADLRSAETDLANAKIEVQKEGEHLADVLRMPIEQLAGLNESNELVPILSSIDGTVIDRKITPGSVVQPGQEVFTITDLGRLWMLASVNESDMSKVREGRAARVLSQAYPDRAFPGRVTNIGSELDPQTRTLQVRIALANPGLALRPQMYANAQIDEGPTASAIFVPEDAVQDINGGSVVFLRKGNEFTVRPVEIAHRLNGEAEIASGLKPGEQIVMKGSFVVKSEMLKSQIGE